MTIVAVLLFALCPFLALPILLSQVPPVLPNPGLGPELQPLVDLANQPGVGKVALSVAALIALVRLVIRFTPWLLGRFPKLSPVLLAPSFSWLAPLLVAVGTPLVASLAGGVPLSFGLLLSAGLAGLASGTSNKPAILADAIHKGEVAAVAVTDKTAALVALREAAKP